MSISAPKKFCLKPSPKAVMMYLPAVITGLLLRCVVDVEPLLCETAVWSVVLLNRALRFGWGRDIVFIAVIITAQM